MYPDGMLVATYSNHSIFNRLSLSCDKENTNFCFLEFDFREPKFHAVKLDDKYIKLKENYVYLRDKIFEYRWFKSLEKDKKRRKKADCDKNYAANIKRAKDKIYDLVALNDWDYFFTGTLGNTSFDPTSAAETLKPLQNWLKDRVKRDGLKYVLVAEYQPKSGRIHWHGFINSALEMTDSGRRSYFGRACDSAFFDKHPEIDREKYPVIYNMPQWKFGWTTAIKTYGENSACARYMMKYITKNTKAVFGRFYWSSRNLVREPFIGYDTVDYDEILCPEYSMPFNQNLKLKYYTFFPGQNDFHWKQSADNSQKIIDILEDFELIDPDNVYSDIDLSDFEEIIPH